MWRANEAEGRIKAVGEMYGGKEKWMVRLRNSAEARGGRERRERRWMKEEMYKKERVDGRWSGEIQDRKDEKRKGRRCIKAKN